MIVDPNGVVYDEMESNIGKTIDCEDPSFASNANCLEYSYQEQNVESDDMLYLYIIGSLILLLLLGLIGYKLRQWKNQDTLINQ